MLLSRDENLPLVVIVLVPRLAIPMQKFQCSGCVMPTLAVRRRGETQPKLLLAIERGGRGVHVILSPCVLYQIYSICYTRSDRLIRLLTHVPKDVIIMCMFILADLTPFIILFTLFLFNIQFSFLVSIGRLFQVWLVMVLSKLSSLSI